MHPIAPPLAGHQADPGPAGPKRIWTWVAAAVVAVGLAISVSRLFVPYSYWLDELWSVATSSEDYAVVLRYTLADVHPPLHPLLLKVWISLFGPGELATRVFSWLCAVTALGLFARAARGKGAIVLLTAVPFFATNTLFTYYANETRSYALTLLFATLVAASYPTGGRAPGRGFYLGCLLLALTHYFGLIIAGVCILVCLAQHLGNRAQALRLVVLGLVCLVWPVCHVLFGGLLSTTGGNFWIKVNGVADSLRIATSGYFPRFSDKGPLFLLAGAGAAAGLALLARRRPAGAPAPASAALVLPFAIITVGFVLLIAVLDLWSPMSTPRNYIVLLPFLALLVGGACSLLTSALPMVRPLVLLAVFAFCLDAARESHRRLAGKARAAQDWKGASALMAAEAAGRHLYYIPAGNTQGSPLIAGIANHYLSTTSGGRLRAQEYRLGVTQPSRPALILFGHNSGEWSQLSSEMQRLGARQIFSGYDATHFGAPGASVGVFLVP